MMVLLWVLALFLVTSAVVILVLWACRQLSLVNYEIRKLDRVMSRKLRRHDKKLDAVRAEMEVVRQWAIRSGRDRNGDRGGVA